MRTILFLLLLPALAGAQTHFFPYSADGSVGQPVVTWPDASLLAELDAADRFGRDHAPCGDVNGDGVEDWVVGARSDDDGAVDAGAVYIVFRNADGGIAEFTKISATAGGLEAELAMGDFFGYGVAGIGDADGDGVPDVACSSPTSQRIFTLLLYPDGTVKAHHVCAGVTAQGLSALGDVNGDGWVDVAACDPLASVGGPNRGAVHILFGSPTGPTGIATTWAHGTSGFPAVLSNGDQFGGREVARIDSGHYAVGAFGADGGAGACWLVHCSPSAQILSATLLAPAPGTPPIPLDASAQWGHALAGPGDLNGDGQADLILGANQQSSTGVAYALLLNGSDAFTEAIPLHTDSPGLPLNLSPNERFGRSISFHPGDPAWLAIGGGAGGTGTVRFLPLRPCEAALHDPTSAPPVTLGGTANCPSGAACRWEAATAGAAGASWAAGACTWYADLGSDAGWTLGCAGDALGAPSPEVAAPVLGCKAAALPEGAWRWQVVDLTGRVLVEGAGTGRWEWPNTGPGWRVFRATDGVQVVRAVCPHP